MRAVEGRLISKGVKKVAKFPSPEARAALRARLEREAKEKKGND